MRSPDLMFRLLLVFALLFVQQGGLAHAVEHAVSEQKQSLPHDKPCELCAAYAQMGSAPTSSLSLQVFVPVIRMQAEMPALSFETCSLLVPAARGPPVLSLS